MKTHFQSKGRPLLMAALAGATLLAALGASSAAVALPTLARAFSADLQQVQWVMLAYLLAVTAAIAGVGRMGDLWGSRRVLLAGLALFMLASATCALAPGLGWLIAARVAQGLGAAALMALPLALAKGLVARQRVGSAMGLLGSMSALGTAAGPALGGLLIGALGWQSAFALLALSGAVMLPMVWLAVPATPEHAGARMDRAGNGLALLRAPALARALAMNLLVAAIMMATLVVGPFFLAFGLGLDAAGTGLAMAAGPAVAALSGWPAGRLTDRFGAGRTLVAGLLLAAIGLGALALLPGWAGVAGYVLGLLLLTPGFQLFLAANNTAVMLGAADAHQGLVSGLLGLSRNLGFLAGAALLPLLFAALLGSPVADSSMPAIGAAFRATFLAAAGVLAVLAALQARPRGSSGQQT